MNIQSQIYIDRLRNEPAIDYYNHAVTHFAAFGKAMFHADDIACEAWLRLKLGDDFPIHRRNPSDDEMAHPEVIVFDVGGDHNYELSNFDHHQDGELPASCNLLIDCFWDDSEELLEEFQKRFLNYISDVDCGTRKEDGYTPTISTIIRNLNSLPNGREMAIALMKTAMLASIETSKQAIEGRGRWEREVEVFGEVAIQSTSKPIVIWREIAEEKGIKLLISPNTRTKGAWQIVSRDSDRWKIPAIEKERQDWIHPNQFMAVYLSRELAIQHAGKIVLHYRHSYTHPSE